MYYGLSGELALNEAINKVIDTIPSKNDKALYRLMYATIEQETLAGRLLDKTEFSAGSGLCQFDKIGFEDTKARCPLKIKNIVKEKLGIDISKCTYDMLEYNAFLSILSDFQA